MPSSQGTKLNVSPNDWDELQSQLNWIFKDIYSLFDSVRGLDGRYSTVRLDTLAEPTDITRLNADTARHGLLPKLDGDSDHVLSGNGLWIPRGVLGPASAIDGNVTSWDGVTGALLKDSGVKSADLLLKTLLDANTIIKADADDTPEALTVPEGTILGRAAGGEIAALDNVTRGYREGLLVTIKDADELYISGGVIEINGTVYEAESQLTVSTGAPSANTLYYIYANKPASGLVLTASEITLSTTAPTFSNILGAYYKTGDATKRLLAKYYQAGLDLSPFYPTANGDDVMWNGIWFRSSAYPYFSFGSGADGDGTQYKTYIRFPSLNINPGDTISSATLSVVAAASSLATVTPVTIYANDVDNTIAPTSRAEGEALVLTTANVAVNIGTFTSGSEYVFPNDLSTVVQEVVNRPGWVSGNALALVVVGAASGANPKYARAYDDGVPAAYPKLDIVLNATSAISKVVDNRKIDIARDSDNVLNSEEILAYDTGLGGFKGLEKSTDGTLADNSDSAIPTEKAVKTYADTKVAKSLFDAQSIIAAVSDDTPIAVTVAEQTLVGRVTGGNIDDLAKASILPIIDLEESDSPTYTNLHLLGAEIDTDNDSTARDLTINCGADKTVVLGEEVWDDIRITPGSFDRPGSSDPTFILYYPNGGGIGTLLPEFEKNDYASFTVQIPHNYKQGGNIYCHAHWTPGPRGAAENGKTVGWKVDYSWANINSNFGDMQTLDLSDACDGTDHKHQMTPEVEISGTGKNISSMLICNIRRSDTGTDDTWVGTSSGELPLLLEIDFHYPIDTIGSRQASAK